MSTEWLYRKRTPFRMFLASGSILALPMIQESSLLSSPVAPFASFGASRPSLSSVYIAQQSVSCFTLFKQAMLWPFALALESAGRSIPARIAMTAITTNNSMSVNPFGRVRLTGFNILAQLCTCGGLDASLKPPQTSDAGGICGRAGTPGPLLEGD